ncbi:MAG: hypothetical protein ACP5N2_01485 [Candidatus Nanoarchaeia archaeon]
MAIKEKEGVLKATDNMVFVLVLGVAFCIAGVYSLVRPFSGSISLVSPILIIAGIGAILLWKKKYLYINRNQGTIYSGSKGIFTNKEFKIAITDVFSVEYNEYVDDLLKIKFIGEEEGKWKNRAFNTSIFLVLKNGVYVPVPCSAHSTTSEKSKGNSINLLMRQKQLRKELDLAKYIANYLNVQFVERRPPTMGEAINIMKEEMFAMQDNKQKKI